MAKHSYTGATIDLRRTGGAALSRIMHPPGQRIEPHCHDWPVLAIYRLGCYREETEYGEKHFDGPSVVFHPAFDDHADEVGAAGLETLSLSFDPTWLETEACDAVPKRSWSRAGGKASLAARQLASVWLNPDADDERLRRATSRFFLEAIGAPEPKRPAWLHDAGAVSGERDLHPAWLARAYRAWRGEGIAETARRRRVECAVQMLRVSSESLSAIAAEVGFCDQSHMNRCFNAVLGRTPLEVRLESSLLAAVC